MRLLLTRPRCESETLAQSLDALGHEAYIEPMLSIVFESQPQIATGNPQAILITSVNAARAFSHHYQDHRYKDTPVFTVGAATADALGRFNVVHVGTKGVAALQEAVCAELKPAAGTLLYVRGVHIAGNLGANLARSGYTVEDAVLYEAVAANRFSAGVLDKFQNNLIDGVVLFSPRTAAVFSKLAEKASLVKKLDGVTFYCLSQNVSDSIELEKNLLRKQIVIARLPTQESLINSICGE